MANSTSRAMDGFVARHQFLFVGGLHRSGTTLIARSLADHPEVSALRGTRVPEDEGQHLQTVYPTAQAFGGPGRFGFARRARLTERARLATRANRDRLLGAWTPYWDVSRRVLVEKSPPNVVRTRFLQALFPDARFVMIVRHPIAVAIATQKWSRTSVASLVAHWLRCHRTLVDDAKRVDRLRVIRYERLVAVPERVGAELLAFLDLDGTLASGGVRAGVNDAYFAEWASRRPAIRDVRLLEAAEPAANAFGYSILEPHARPAPSPTVARVLGAWD